MEGVHQQHDRLRLRQGSGAVEDWNWLELEAER